MMRPRGKAAALVLTTVTNCFTEIATVQASYLRDTCHESPDPAISVRSVAT